MAKIQIDIDLPDTLIKSFLQHVRDYDVKHMNEVALAIWIPQTKFTGEEMLAVVQSIKPSMETLHKIPIHFPGARP